MSAGFEKPRDVVGGLVVVGIGGLFLLFGRELPVGSSFRMGPGYFPAILSWLMGSVGRNGQNSPLGSEVFEPAWCTGYEPGCSKPDPVRGQAIQT